MLRTAVISIALSLALPAAAQSSAPGEASRAPAPVPLQWRAAAPSPAQVAHLRFGEMPARRLLDLQRKNAAVAGQRVPLQVGIGRQADTESAEGTLPALQWQAVAGGHVARVQVRSGGALSLRVGIDASSLHDRVELRFAGSDRPGEVIALVTGAQAKRLPGDDGLYWSPNTDGEVQVIEVFRPTGVPAMAARLQVPSLSHLIVDTRNPYKVIEKIGESGTCNIDVVCKVNEYGNAFVQAKAAVAHMRFVVGSSTFICTGTLLNDTVPQTQVPYFHSANHCFSSNTNVAPNPTQMQTVANTLTTFWNYEATACGGLTSSTTTQVTGGATYLYSTNVTDGMLLRLNGTPPASAYFAGWIAAPVPVGTTVYAIHHPAGDAKMVSRGQSIAANAQEITVGWSEGTTEGGSSGSGLFTLGPDGWVLRGGLYGGFASCANTGNLGNSQNRDFYSPMDVDINAMRQWLEPQPTAANGNRARVRPRTASKPVAPANAAPVAPRTAPAERAERTRR